MKNFIILLNNTSKNFIRYYSSRAAMSDLRPLIAVAQMTSKSDKEANFNICKDLIDQAKQRGAKMIFLPECFDYVGENKNQSLELAENLDGPLIKSYQKVASDYNIWLSLGGFHQKSHDLNDPRVFNSHLVIDSNGEVASLYNKTHLFNVDLPGNVRMRESDYTIPGSAIMPPVSTPVGKVGLGVCYDLRFSEFSIALRKAGADILTYPSAFTQTTGQAHWESLLRCRAIETQCYVVAAAQTGVHSAKRASYGHAMIVDPWGCVLARCKEGTGIAVAEVDHQFLQKVRSDIPVLEHRRHELYTTPDSSLIDDTPLYSFGTVNLASSQIFYKTALSFAFVNRKPVVPGHVLVSPLRVVKKFQDMNAEEITDFFLTVQKVAKIMEVVHNTDACTMTIQDGELAGQTIPHVHMHILPRKEGDFEENNDIYKELQKHDKDVKPSMWRDQQDMAKETAILRPLF